MTYLDRSRTEAGEASLLERTGPWWKLRHRIHQDQILQVYAQADSGIVLKTDLFDEASGPYHPATDLPQGLRFIGIDINFDIARKARDRLSDCQINAVCLVADVRCLPFANQSLSGIISLSTLDHFNAASDIEVSLKELHRVLNREGILFLTLDNPWNWEVFFRRVLPDAVVTRLRADTFFLGETLTIRQAAELFSGIGLFVVEHRFIVHAFRYAAIRVLALVDRRLPSKWVDAMLLVLLWLEKLDRTPFRSLSGHYSAWILTRSLPKSVFGAHR